MHTLFELRGNIPATIHVSYGKMANINALDILPIKVGDFYIMDRGNVEFDRLYLLLKKPDKQFNSRNTTNTTNTTRGSNMKWKSMIFLPLLITSNAHAITIGEIINPLESFMECSNLKWYETAICLAVTKEINQKLKEKSISFSNGDILYRIEPVVSSGSIDTGHSCTHTANIRSSYATATLNSSGIIDLDFEEISTPIVAFLELPVGFYAKVNLEEEWGTMVFGSCEEYASDSYYADGSASVTAFTRIVVSMEPKLEALSNGDYQVTTEPLVDVTSGFNDIDIDFDLHGKSVLNGIATLISSGLSAPINTLEAGLAGDSMMEELKQFGIDTLVGSFQIFESISDNLFNDILISAVEDVAKKKAEEKGENIASQLEDKIKDNIIDNLNLDANGKRIYLVEKSKVQKYIASVFVGTNHYTSW